MLLDRAVPMRQVTDPVTGDEDKHKQLQERKKYTSVCHVFIFSKSCRRSVRGQRCQNFIGLMLTNCRKSVGFARGNDAVVSLVIRMHEIVQWFTLRWVLCSHE